MRNKFCLALVLLLIMLQNGYAFAADNREILERSIGKLILMSDSVYSYEHGDSPFGDSKTAHEAAVLYEKHIRHLPEKSRVDYFWALMWHFSFVFTSEFVLFADPILRDCGPAFLKKLEKYIEKEENIQRNERKLQIAKNFLRDLKVYQKAKSKGSKIKAPEK